MRGSSTTRATVSCLAAIGLAVAASACSSSQKGASTGSTNSGTSGSGPGTKSPGTIVIGNVEDLSGASSVLGIPENQGAQMAVDEINAAGGIKSLGGAKLELKKFDTASNPDNASTETQAAIAAHVVAIIGGENSNTVQTGTNISQRAGIPWLNTGGTSDGILQRGYQGVFTVDFDSSQFAGGWLQGLGAAASQVGVTSKTMTVPYSDSDYGHEFLTAMQGLHNGGFSIKSSFSYPLTTTDFGTVADRASTTGASVVFNVGYPNDGVSIVKLWGTQYKPAGAKVVGTAGTSCAILAPLGSAANGDLCLFALMPGDKGATPYYAQEFQKYQSTYKAAPIEWNGFTAVYFLAAALEKAGSTSGSALDSALHSVSLSPGQGDIYDQPLAFDKTGAITYWPVIIGQMENGSSTSVYPTAFASAPIKAYGS